MNTQTENTAIANAPVSTDGFAPTFDSGPRPHPATKISRLPAEVREFINQSLADNLSYPKIISRLNEMGHPRISPQNLSKWARSGYRIWLNYRQNLDVIRVQAEVNRDLLRDLGTTDAASFHRLNDLFVANKLGRLVRSFNVDTIERELLQDPMNFFRVSRSISAHTRNVLRQQKLQAELAKQQTMQLERDQRDLGQLQPTTSAAGYAAIAAEFGLPPRFSVPLPTPKDTNPEHQTTTNDPTEISNVNSGKNPSNQTS